MKIMTKILIAVTIVTIGLSCPFVATAAQQLTEGEEAHLIFMRSEEKLARDVYLTLGEMYPNMPVFYNIACGAEQTHTEQINDLFDKFNIPEKDPEPDTVTVDGCPDTLPSNIGEFNNPYFSGYFFGKYTALILMATDELNAAKVGAFIEELDMLDINYCNEVIYDPPYELPGDTLPCGLVGVPPPGDPVPPVKPLEQRLENLLSGSKNHLCAFISQIVRRIPPDECYEAQVLPQSEVNGYVGDVCPELLNYVCSP
jgi:hypothetical protein